MPPGTNRAACRFASKQHHGGPHGSSPCVVARSAPQTAAIFASAPTSGKLCPPEPEASFDGGPAGRRNRRKPLRIIRYETDTCRSVNLTPHRPCGRADERILRTTILGPSTRPSAEPPETPPQYSQLVWPACPNFTRCAHEPIHPHKRCRSLALPGLRHRQPRLVATGIAENAARPRRLRRPQLPRVTKIRFAAPLRFLRPLRAVPFRPAPVREPL